MEPKAVSLFCGSNWLRSEWCIYWKSCKSQKLISSYCRRRVSMGKWKKHVLFLKLTFFFVDVFSPFLKSGWCFFFPQKWDKWVLCRISIWIHGCLRQDLLARLRHPLHNCFSIKPGFENDIGRVVEMWRSFLSWRSFGKTSQPPKNLT